MTFNNRLTTKPSKDFSKEDELLDWNTDEGFRQFESGFYSCDENHSGRLLVTQAMVDKWDLHEKWGCVEPLEVDCGLLDGMDDEEKEEFWSYLPHRNYVGEIYIQHATHYAKTKEGLNDWKEWVDDTPHGDIYSNEFVAWWNDFPIELLNEPETEVYVWGWKDG
jgi:hypothetical protein